MFRLLKVTCCFNRMGNSIYQLNLSVIVLHDNINLCWFFCSDLYKKPTFGLFTANFLQLLFFYSMPRREHLNFLFVINFNLYLSWFIRHIQKLYYYLNRVNFIYFIFSANKSFIYICFWCYWHIFIQFSQLFLLTSLHLWRYFKLEIYNFIIIISNSHISNFSSIHINSHPLSLWNW